MRYPDQKQEYDNMREELLEGTPFNDGQPRSNLNGNRTESAIIKFNSSPHIQRIEREIKAVEKAYEQLREEEKKIIRVRYWNCRWRKTPYLKIRNANYSERQMKRIVFKVIDLIGKDLGELE